jgi:hypothetical protein
MMMFVRDTEPERPEKALLVRKTGALGRLISFGKSDSCNGSVCLFRRKTMHLAQVAVSLLLPKGPSSSLPASEFATTCSATAICNDL